MQKHVKIVAVIAVAGLVGCEGMTRQEQMVVGGLTGAAIGGMTAKALEKDDDWVILGVLAGAAVGTLVAQNNATRECAYARGDGTYYVRTCP